MSAQFSSKVENMLGSLERTAQLFVQYGGEDSCDPNTFTKMGKEICDLEIDNNVVLKAVEQSRDKETVADFESAYRSTQAGSRQKTSKRYNAFATSIKQHLVKPGRASTSHEPQTVQADDDVEFDAFVSDIDPITKKPMVHPVKNKKCGHYYEKDSIMEAIKINRKLRCPVAGCGHKQPINPNDLVADPAFAKRLREQQQQQHDQEDSD